MNGPAASVSALITAGAVLFFLGIFAGASDVIKIALFAMGLGAFVAAGLFEVVGRRA